jgi:hypothetical protein
MKMKTQEKNQKIIAVLRSQFEFNKLGLIGYSDTKTFDSFDTGYAVVAGGYLFIQSENVEWDNHRYSKSWHRAHGGVKVVSDRKITIYDYNGRKKQKLNPVAVVDFDAWRGNILLTAIKKSGLFQEPESKAPLSVRLDRFYDAKIIKTIGHVKIYERTLLGDHVDYVAVLNGVTFHADHGSTPKDAVKGLHIKIKAAAKKRNEPISYKLCKELGFCDAGIKQFCSAFDLDIKDTFSPAYIEELVKAEPEKAEPFEHELRVVAKTLNYQPSI